MSTLETIINPKQRKAKKAQNLHTPTRFIRRWTAWKHMYCRYRH